MIDTFGRYYEILFTLPEDVMGNEEKLAQLEQAQVFLKYLAY
jgi:hypothetical protein